MAFVRVEHEGNVLCTCGLSINGCLISILLFIETTFMRYGHGSGGIVGIMLNEHALCCWALNLHICSRLTKDIAYLKEATLFEVDHYKEQSHSRIKADDDNRNAIRDKLDTCVDPLDVAQGQHLINIVTVKMSNKNVIVEDAVQIAEAHNSNRLVS